MGKIPKNWKTDRLKNVADINQEVISEKSSPDYELKYIDIGNVTSNGDFLELQEMNNEIKQTIRNMFFVKFI